MDASLKSLSKTGLLLKNEDGAVLVAALLILVLLTIIGIASTNISNTEVQIAGHEVVYQQNFYRAEGATIEALEQLDAISDPKFAAPAWLELTPDTVTNDDISDYSFWQTGSGSVTPEPSAVLSDTSFVVVSEGIVHGSSLAMGSSKVHEYYIYGRCAPPKRGATVVHIGYLKAF
jgi:Tfp pilus assembly protein PilX